jgi:hypothetical protein
VSKTREEMFIIADGVKSIFIILRRGNITQFMEKTFEELTEEQFEILIRNIVLGNQSYYYYKFL